MTKRQSLQYEMLARVQKFGESHRDAFPDTSVAGQAFATVAASAEQLARNAIVKLAAAREGQIKKQDARKALVDRLGQIVRTAQSIARTSSGFDEKFQRPALITDQGLLTAGKTFIEAAEPRVKQFLTHGLPDTFLSDLKERVTTLEQAVAERAQGRSELAQAQTAIRSALQAGLDAVDTLDVIVTNFFEKDAVALAAWHRDSKVQQGPKPRAANGTTTKGGKKTTASAAPAASQPLAPSAAQPAAPAASADPKQPTLAA